MKLTDFANWKWIRTMLLYTSPFWLTSVAYFGLGVQTWVQGIGDLQTSYAAHLEEYGQMGTVLVQIQKSLEKIDAKQNEAIKRDMTLQGEGRAGNFGDSEAFVMINIESNARIYEGQKEVRVYNLSSESPRQLVFSINGTISDRVSTRLVEFSRMAADLLQVEGTIKLRLEPIVEEK